MAMAQGRLAEREFLAFADDYVRVWASGLASKLPLTTAFKRRITSSDDAGYSLSVAVLSTEHGVVPLYYQMDVSVRYFVRSGAITCSACDVEL